MKTYKNLNIVYFLLITALAFLLNACAVEEGIPVKADFSIKVVNNDYSVPVKVEITNKSTGADTFDWSFEGASVSNSTEKSPQPITYAEPGVYKIRLKASNKDGNVDSKEIEVKVYPAVSADFDWEMQGSDISPVTLKMSNQSLGATQYSWEFDGGNPASSNEENPEVIFVTPGDHTTKLTVSNGLEPYSVQKVVNVKPAMTVDFNWTVDPIDNDYQAPVLLHLHNLSTNAVSYEWTVAGGVPAVSTDVHPDIKLPTAGTYTIILKSTNDKETKVLQKQVTVLADTNLLSFTDVKLGINTAHSSIGCFFSSELGTVLKKGEVNTENGSKVDFAYFGLNSSFMYNQFVSPDEVQNTSFVAIPNAIHTKIINSQELVGNQLSSSGFDNISSGTHFSSVSVSETSAGKSPFGNSIIPRVILFQTADGRKGAVKIKNFVPNASESYIVADIKIQKQP